MSQPTKNDGLTLLMAFRPGSFLVVRPIEPDEFQRINDALTSLAAVSRFHDVFFVLLGNVYAFFEWAQATVDGRLERDLNDEMAFNSVPSNANRFLINVLTAFRMYDDHMTHLLHGRFGEASPEAALYRALKNAEYDKTFPYRFMYKLRNFAQHVGMPIHSINLVDAVDPSGIPSTATASSVSRHIALSLRMKRQSLLKYKKWGTVHTDILSQPEEIEVGPLVRGLLESVERTHTRLTSELNKHVEGDASFLQAIEDALRKAHPGFRAVVATNFSITDGNLVDLPEGGQFQQRSWTGTLRQFPLDQIARILGHPHLTLGGAEQPTSRPPSLVLEKTQLLRDTGIAKESP